MIEPYKMHYETHKLRSTAKMSSAATPSASNNCRSNKRFPFLLKGTLLSTLITCLLVVQLQTPAAKASSQPDYGDPEGLQIGSSAGDTASSDEIYDPAQLQQEIETMEGNSNVERMDFETETPAEARINNATENRIINEEPQQQQQQQQELESTTAELANNIKESSGEEDLAAKEQDSHDFKAERQKNAADDIITTTSPSMVPLYVQRKPKAEALHPAAGSPERASSADSTSDYAEGDEDPISSVYQRSQQDDIMPLAMKFYQAAEDNGDNNFNNVPAAMPLLQQQLVPRQHLEQRFYNNSEEEYYEDSVEDGVEQLVKQHAMTTEPSNYAAVMMTTTAAAATTTTPTPVVTPTFTPIIDIAGDIIASFSTTTTTATATTTSTYGFPEYSTTTTSAATTATTATTTKTTATSTTTPAMNRNDDNLSTTKRISTKTKPAAPSAPATPPPTTSASATPSAAPPTRPATGNKQGKQIIISRRKMLPHEQLRNYIEDAYIRMPLAVIVDPSAEPLEKTKALWRDALRTNLNIKIVLVALNASGVPTAYSFNNTQQFLAGLNSIKENEGGDSFIGIVHASELVPYDSAVFISTASLPPHTELVQDAAITLLKKRIRLYLIWYGERSLSENETQDAVGGILGEVAIRSGGEVLHIVGSENSQELESDTLTLIADAFRGSQEVDVPVDTTLSSIHVKIDLPMRTATLETPNGDINLKKLVKFKPRSLAMDSVDRSLDAYVPLRKLRKSSVYKMKLVPESLEDDYRVFVRADRKADILLGDIIKNFDGNFLNSRTVHSEQVQKSILKEKIVPKETVTTRTHEKLRFPEDMEEQQNPKSEVETFSDTEILKIPANDTASVINSNDLSANGNQRTGLPQAGHTKIEMGIQSQVLVAPGMMAQLYFEITNSRTESVYHNIQVIDERRYLQRLSHQSILLPADATSTVTVTVLIPAGTPHGTTDRITFTCYGSHAVSQSVNLRVITDQDAKDTIEPNLSWSFNSRCDSADSSTESCSDRFWVLDITAQDWQTGILRLQTTPASGLVYRNSYAVGSTEPLRATYIATCCQPKVSLLAHDVAGNQKAVTVDVRDLVLTEASIAAIILGVLLLILLIVLLIVLIVWCCRRRKVTLDLPTYRSHSSRNVE